MIVGQRGSLVGVLRWQARSIVLFMVSAAVTVCLREFAGWHWLVLPTTPIAVVGGALGIFVSFRTNAAYNRWWEGRQLWGKLVNASRMWSTQVLGYLPRGEDGKPSELQTRLVTQQVLYVHLLRCLLRVQDPRTDEDIIRYSSAEERERIAKQSNPTHALLHEMHAAVTAEADAGRLDELRLQSLDRTIMTFLDVQGGCERIKKTPMPRGYGFFAEQLIRAYGLLFPLVIAEDMGFAAVPINALVCLAFLSISETGRVLEDPFTMFWNGLPLSTLSRTIENNIRERLGATDLQPAIKEIEPGILM